MLKERKKQNLGSRSLLLLQGRAIYLIEKLLQAFFFMWAVNISSSSIIFQLVRFSKY